MVHTPRLSPARLVLRIILLTLAYVIAGRLSVLLAISPGFTSGIFIPMGIYPVYASVRAAQHPVLPEQLLG